MIGLTYLDDDDELACYDIILVDDDGNEQIILGEVELPDDPFCWTFGQIAHIGSVPAMHSYVTGRNPMGAVTVNASLPGFNFAGKPYLKMGLRYGTVKKEPGEGWCYKCDERGDFVRTALVCPNCGDLLGGF